MEPIYIEPEVEVLPAIDDVLLLDYVDLDGNKVPAHHVETESVTVDGLEILDDPYHKGDLISVDGEVCERAVGHDGYYDSVTGEWMLEDDLDYEPEWRCLMRPLLRDSVKGVGAAELSIESKGILEEKQALVRVHEKLVMEAEKVAEKKNCLEYIERKMSKYQECELQVLRDYVKVEAAYPQSWVDFLHAKKVCVDKFSDEVHDCSHMFIIDVTAPENHEDHTHSHSDGVQVNHVSPYATSNNFNVDVEVVSVN